ncbi:MAG: hypothetical protein PVH65_14665, partial [Chloroflexota bacterium]|jgi:alkyl hydroperoxide reductase subunit AhpF
MAKLDVYISECCWTCDEARQIVADMRPLFPNVKMELRDIGDERRPRSVFATPTYVLNGRTISLGNPTREQLRQRLEDAQTPSGLR